MMKRMIRMGGRREQEAGRTGGREKEGGSRSAASREVGIDVEKIHKCQRDTMDAKLKLQREFPASRPI